MIKMMIFLATMLLISSFASAQTVTIVVGQNSAQSDSAAATRIADTLKEQGYTARIVPDINYRDDVNGTLISIGGSCVNSVSASMLDLDYPTCGEKFRSSTDVGPNQYMMNTYSMGDGRVAILIAGYEASDTINAASYLLNRTISDIEAGLSLIGNSSAELALEGRTLNVNINNFAYTPETLTINKGDRVIWTNSESGTAHTVTSDSSNELSSSTLEPGDTFSHIFNTQGTYAYHCNIHPSMKGTVIVS